ncbi:MAG: hypothetical protein K9N23_03290 [Akkermansiaceae bacterium]|nr:hypothetical protein [Akkermansiaceae bacterium]
MKASLHLILAAFASLLVVSCYPYPENRPHKGAKPNPGPETTGVQKSEADLLKEKEDAAKKKEELEKKEEALRQEQENLSGGDNPSKPPKPPVRSQYEVAKKAPGKEGFVLSPYNRKLIDVRGIASGTLVTDPTYDPSEKKYFRVP